MHSLQQTFQFLNGHGARQSLGQLLGFRMVRTADGYSSSSELRHTHTHTHTQRRRLGYIEGEGGIQRRELSSSDLVDWIGVSTSRGMLCTDRERGEKVCVCVCVCVITPINKSHLLLSANLANRG